MTSDMTFFCKFIFTPVWIIGFGIGAGTIYMQNGNTRIILMWLLGTAFLLWTWARLKKVLLSPFSRKLYISNFHREIEVSFDEVEKVYAFPLLTPELIFIRFKTTTDFGQTIIFMPKYRFFGGYSEHPEVAALRDMIFSK